METYKESKAFSIFQYEQEQEYLQMMHKKGWKFVYVSNSGKYQFEKCEPEDVVYQLDYNREGLENKSEYVQMFEDCGWEYILDRWGYSYFRKPKSQMNGDESIFCDDESRLEMMDRVFKGRLSPMVVILFMLIIPQLLLCSTRPAMRPVAIFYFIMFVIYMVIFTIFAVQRNRFKKKIGK
ncbi:MAG: DUF2812 domain-containing protein [Lachnospiraceae bacterium]|nr:DUF2812 domain-containing protein [Lachnospiraceae bacterium]